MATEVILEDVAAVSRIDAVPSILEIVCRITGLRFAAVARVTDKEWVACAVRDEIEFGLQVGGSLDLKTTICDEIRDSRTGVIIDHVSEDPVFCTHHTPRRYGFESYISIPIVKPSGEFFGTLCALDPLPAKLREPGIVATFENFAHLIGMQLAMQDELASKDDQIARAGSTAVIRERFIAILGHDLRNPIAALAAGTDMLKRINSAPRSALILAQMEQSLQRAKLLIDDLLDFARGHLGNGLTLRVSFNPDLGVPLRQTIAELQIVHPDQPIELDTAFDEPVRCDVDRITQLLSNLVSNALTHGAKSKPVRVRAESRNGQFVLTVANQGAPIAKDKMRHLFDPFSGNSDGTKGLGLGLFIAHEIATAHNGSIDVASDEHETCFRLTMPSTC